MLEFVVKIEQDIHKLHTAFNDSSKDSTFIATNCFTTNEKN